MADVTYAPRIALTGATGFIGSRIARHLARQGFRLRVLVRPSSEHRLSVEVPVEVCRGALADERALQQLLDQADVLVHCAGLVRGLTQTEFDAVNVAGTQRLVQLAKQKDRPPRLVFISSLAAREPQLSPYALSKYRAEQAIVELGQGLSWLILRPPAVYGPGDRELLPLLKVMARGILPILGPKTGRFSLLFVDDLVRAVEKAVLSPEVACQIFELHDGKLEGYSWDEIWAIAQNYRRGSVVCLQLPEWSLRALAQLNQWGSRLLGQTPMLTQGKVNELRHPNWVCDNAAVSKALDWQPKVQLAQGLKLTLSETQPKSTYSVRSQR
ncbi:MAG: SDR family NAD(P)-dependent oxidoreductase [Methylohalobius sp.]|nr:SDR family NAD(P)-dependent oxidoreductase [Methylohalobius sp.]